VRVSVLIVNDRAYAALDACLAKHAGWFGAPRRGAVVPPPADALS
jgi:hypothetical protein